MSKEQTMENVELERAEIYKDPPAERLLTELFEKGTAIEPDFDLEHGHRYPRAEDLLERGPDEAKAFLEKLSEAGVLVKEPFDRAICCPSCGSPNVSTNYACPHDDSTNIERDSLIEHLACGYIDAHSKFRQGDELVCPQCRATLTPGSFRVPGSWNQCRTCGRRLEVLSVLHRCRKCGEEFTFERARFEDAFTYSLSEGTKNDIGRGVFYTSQLRDIFEKSGYSLRTPPVLKGASGIDYEFDLVAVAPDGGEVTVDVNFSEEPMPREALMEKYGKLADTRKQFYLIVAPPLHDKLRQLSVSLGMNVIQGEKPYEALQLFSQELTSMPEPHRDRTARPKIREHIIAARKYIIAAVVSAALFFVIGYAAVPQIREMIRSILTHFL